MTNLKDIAKICQEFNNDPKLIENKLKVVQSTKCRFKKCKKTATYDQQMSELLNYEQVLKEARATLVPKKKFVTDFTQSDIDQLDYDESVKAIKSIQSKKCLSQQYNDSTEYNKSVAIESMLKQHIATVKPVDDSYIRRTDLNTIINTIENDIVSITTDRILELLNNL